MFARLREKMRLELKEFQKTGIPIDRHFKLSSPHSIIGTKKP